MLHKVLGNLGNWAAFSTVSTLALVALGLSSCLNVFDPLDNPSGDAQLLSAARACFDKGDFACARENYGKLSGSLADTSTAEQAFISLDEQGASMAAFMDFVANVSDKGTGSALTTFSERLSSDAGETKRVAIWKAYQKYKSISDASLQSFVQFIGATALAAELLSEVATSNLLYKTALVASASCPTSTCAISALCNEPTGTILQASNGINITTTSPTGNPYMNEVYSAVSEAITGLQGLNASGRFSSVISTYNTLLTKGVAPTTNNDIGDRCFRAYLLDQSIGR